MDSKSGGEQNEPRPITVAILALYPHKGQTPWWVKVARLQHSHIVVVVGDVIWDQPWKGRAEAYSSDEWSIAHEVKGRRFTQATFTIKDHDPWQWLEACKYIEDRKSQRARTWLRWLHLWPWPAWNCTSPVRILLNSLDFDLKLTGETPDDIIREIHTALRSASDTVPDRSGS